MKTKVYLFFASLILTFAATTLNTRAAITATNTTTTVTYSKDDIAKMTVEQRQTHIAEIKQRVIEIKAMDKSTLNSDQKKELRTELKSMHKNANTLSKANGGSGIYLSVGGLLVIILILILVIH